MVRKNLLLIAAASLAFSLGVTNAFADDCSGHDHTGSTILGGVLGGVLGGAVTHGNAGGVIGGAILGGLAGNAVSRDMDCGDRPYAAQSYDESFRGRPGERHDWRNGDDRGYVVTDREYRRGPRLCRDFTQVVYRHGGEFDRHGTACQRRNGEWEFQ
jgi:surface antigen